MGGPVGGEEVASACTRAPSRAHALAAAFSRICSLHTWLRLSYSSGTLARGFGVARSCVASNAAVLPRSFSAQFQPGYYYYGRWCGWYWEGGGDKQGTFARFARFARFFQRKGVERSPKIFFFPRQKKKKICQTGQGLWVAKWCANLATPANHLRLCGGAPPLHAHARLRARRARRTGTGHRRDPWQSPLHPGSPREARSALAFEMRWLISLPSPETCGISGRVAEARAELQAHRGPRGGSAAVSGGSLGPHVVAWVLAEGRSTTCARPHTMWRTQRH